MTNGAGPHKKAVKKVAAKPKSKGARAALKKRGWLPPDGVKAKNA